MVATRLLGSAITAPDELVVREFELVEWEEPPPPPPEPEPDEPDDMPPPPPAAALPDLLPTDDLEAPTMATTNQPVPLTLGVDSFSSATSVASLPQPQPTKAPPKVAPPRPAAPPKKSTYNIGELDSKPNVISYPRVSFPRSLSRKGIKQGKALVEVTIAPNGRSSLRRIISISHPELEGEVTKLVNGARFSPPRKNGEPVSATMRWPLVIR